MSQNQQAAQPPKPTCKAVVRHNQGGARVHPKGCRVRYKVQPGGQIRKVSKTTGQLKPVKTKVVERGNNYYLTVRRSGGRSSQSSRFLWDSGASKTSMSNTVAKRIGILTQNGQLRAPLRYGPDIPMRLANGQVITAKSIRRAKHICARSQEDACKLKRHVSTS